MIRSALALIVLAFSPLNASAADDLPFVGTWDCEVATFKFTNDTYDNGSEVLQIEEAQEGTDASYTLMFKDDYMITLSGISGDEMGWFSPASGDNFNCKRVED